jgi:hypothetical protein
MRIEQSSLLLLVLRLCSLCVGQAHDHLLVLGEEKGCRHASVSRARATIERLGGKTGPLRYHHPYRHGSAPQEKFRMQRQELWDDPRLQELCIAAIKWAMGLVDANVTSRPLPSK